MSSPCVATLATGFAPFTNASDMPSPVPMAMGYPSTNRVPEFSRGMSYDT